MTDDAIEFDEQTDAPEPQAEKTELQGYRRPPRKQQRRRILSIASLAFALIALFLLGILATHLFLSYRQGNIDAGDIAIAKLGIILAGVFSLIAFALSILTFILRKQRKGAAIAALIIAVIILLISGVAVYGYNYIFGNIQTDSDFNLLDNDQIYVVETQPNGQIVENTIPDGSASSEEVNALADLEEVEWEYLTDKDLPQEALDAMHAMEPINHSYLQKGAEQISNFLLLGLDKNGSSDTIILFSFDRAHHKVKMLSIPRDSYVRIPAFGTYAKLNYAYNWGGAAWSVGTVNQNFSLNISDYITVDFTQLAEIIDYIGGVEIEVDAQEIRSMNNCTDVYIGRCLLNGEAAVTYSRIRTDSEQNRTGRQREVLGAILEAVKAMPMTEYPALIRYCLAACQTSFEADALLGLAVEAAQNGYSIEQHSLLEMVDYWGGRLGEERYFYCVYDLGIASDRIYRTIYEELYISGYPDYTVATEE